MARSGRLSVCGVHPCQSLLGPRARRIILPLIGLPPHPGRVSLHLQNHLGADSRSQDGPQPGLRWVQRLDSAALLSSLYFQMGPESRLASTPGKPTEVATEKGRGLCCLPEKHSVATTTGTPQRGFQVPEFPTMPSGAKGRSARHLAWGEGGGGGAALKPCSCHGDGESHQAGPSTGPTQGHPLLTATVPTRLCSDTSA